MSGVAEPVYFGRVERPLFGWIHRPPGTSVPAVGVVICNPFGSLTRCPPRGGQILASARCVQKSGVVAEEVASGRR